MDSTTEAYIKKRSGLLLYITGYGIINIYKIGQRCQFFKTFIFVTDIDRK